jgi:guanosine-3',5'-bis(diphosphate) 3'-pyrophosphohydrolase
MDLFTKSLVFASFKHRGQRRKQAGDIPYINHPIEVAHILSLAGITDYQILAAAILHDTVEDT